MTFKSNYVEVSPSVLMDPSLKVSIALGRLNFESGGDQEVNVYYDSEIESDRMIVPVSMTPHFVQSVNQKLRVDPNKLVPFYSINSRKIATFSLSGSMDGDALVWTLYLDSYHILLKSKLISKEMIDGVSSSSLSFFIDVIGNLIRLRNWPTMYGIKPSTIKIRVKREAIENISNLCVPPNWIVDGDYLIIGEREVQS